MKELTIVAYPYASQTGTLYVPDHIPPEDYEQYVEDHFRDIIFQDPELDYRGTDFDVYAIHS